MQGEWVGAGTCLAFHEIVDGDRKGEKEEEEEDGREEREVQWCCGARRSGRLWATGSPARVWMPVGSESRRWLSKDAAAGTGGSLWY